MRFEDEVALAFKTIGYPFPISKTGIVAVGAPHSWPALIAAIDWLIDFLGMIESEMGPDMDGMQNGLRDGMGDRMEFELEVGNANEGDDNKEDNENEETTAQVSQDNEMDQLITSDESELRATTQFMKFVRHSMNAFMEGDDEKIEVLECQLMEDFEVDNGKLEKYLEELDGESKVMEGAINELNSEANG